MKRSLMTIAMLWCSVTNAAPGWIQVTSDMLILDDVTITYDTYTNQRYRFEGWVFYKSLNQYRTFIIGCGNTGYYREAFEGKVVKEQNSISPVDPLWNFKKVYCK